MFQGGGVSGWVVLQAATSYTVDSEVAGESTYRASLDGLRLGRETKLNTASPFCRVQGSGLRVSLMRSASLTLSRRFPCNSHTATGLR